ncbi:MAG: putative Sulfite:cytochrome c oxidoreductase, subunit [Candidatus Eremiobacteraeota bacterium]|nr:putative Sulfite:cytochrome c oxidoreductase, subunit [Candidatus Eremiobacteraeota bacterium]
MRTRLQFLTTLGSTVAAGALPRPAFAAAGDTMIVVNSRPFDYETPLGELAPSVYTANRTFFIRSHMGPPASIDVHAWRLVVDGLVAHPLQLSLDDLRKMQKVEVASVLQCSGNGRYFFGKAYPTVSHPAGAQWTYGGVGNARWGGVRVRDVLARAGVRPGARFSTNSGLDNPVLPTTPKFIRGIELAKLLDPDTILAYEMNGQPLPYEHGYPVRLLVPGWAGDHSVKWIAHMTLAPTLTTDFWTAVGYRYPNQLGPPGKGVPPQAEHPLTALNVKSIITAPDTSTRVRAGAPNSVSGIAWSGDGAQVNRVEVSIDGGRTWRDAKLGTSPGRYSWRTFTYSWTPAAGSAIILARAHDDRGAVQPNVSPWNPGGYLWNAIQRVNVEVSAA